MTGAELIAAERRRQVKEEGWTPEHDDEHGDDDLVRAARCYLLAVLDLQRWAKATGNIPVDWPWNSEWWKPSDDPTRNLTKAGALIAAEIDRLKQSPTP